jgi:hypothetical protein
MPPHTTFVELIQTLYMIPRQSAMPEGISRPGISQLRPASEKHISKMKNGLEVITQLLTYSKQPHRSFQKLPYAPKQAECKTMSF